MATATKARRSEALPKDPAAATAPPAVTEVRAVEHPLEEVPLHAGDWIALWACVAGLAILGIMQFFQTFGVSWYHFFDLFR